MFQSVRYQWLCISTLYVHYGTYDTYSPRYKRDYDVNRRCLCSYLLPYIADLIFLALFCFLGRGKWSLSFTYQTFNRRLNSYSIMTKRIRSDLSWPRDNWIHYPCSCLWNHKVVKLPQRLRDHTTENVGKSVSRWDNFFSMTIDRYAGSP